MRILVTGATGFVGRHLVTQLADRHDVVAVVRPSSMALDAPAVATVATDLTDPKFVDRLPTDLDVIVHLAQAYLPFPDRTEELFLVNTASTQWLAEHARRHGIGRFVLASSGSVYRPAREPLREDSATEPSGFHPTTKLMAEMLLSQYAPYLQVAVVRLFAPYGPGQVDRLIPRMVESVTEGRPVMLSRGGEPRINPMHVDDLVPILARVVEDDRRYTVNVAGSRAVSIRELAELIGSIVGRDPVFTERDSDVSGDFVADTSLLHRLFDVTERIPLERGLETMVGIAAPRAQ